MMENIIDLNKFAGGALAEKVNTELQSILENISDPNTEAKKARKLTLTISLKPTMNRTGAQVNIQTKSTLVPVIPTETSIVIDKDIKTGKVLAAEIGNQIVGQMELEVEEELPQRPDVIDLRKTSKK